MKIEHFRALHLDKFQKEYKEGRQDAKDIILKTRHYQNLSKAFDLIVQRRFRRAAYYIGYADYQKPDIEVRSHIVSRVKRPLPTISIKHNW